MSLRLSSYYIALLGLLFACSQTNRQLPILGERSFDKNGDTVYHKVSDFKFINQDSQRVDNTTFNDMVYVTDFFFTSCPTICPKVKQQMLRIYERFESEPRVSLLSHSIDVRYDTVPALHDFAKKIGVKAPKWHFVTGDEFEIFNTAEEYFVTAKKDPTAPGGFDHSGRLILIDPNRHVRAFCNGTDAADVDRFMEEIQLLLNEI